MAPNRVIHASHTKEDTIIIGRSINVGGQRSTWSLGGEWDCAHLRSTHNGYYAGVHSCNLLNQKSRYDKKRDRLGLITHKSDAIQWITTIPLKDAMPDISNVAVSEDGKYLAAVGVDDGGGWILMADVAQKKVLWQKVPHGDEVPHGIWTVGFNDVSFFPDSKHVYVAGNVGLFCFEVATGRILSQWQIDGRFISVAVSPDGQLVAGGTELYGSVHIYQAKTGKPLLILLTGQYTVYGLAFSPDSTMLATSGVKYTNVKIWKMPSQDSVGPEAGKSNEAKQE
jgi:WD40 repeat protein